MKARFALVAALAFLAGCCCTPKPAADVAPPPVAAQPSSPDTCGMARFQNLIGQPSSAIDRAALPPGTRILEPDSIVTQDFRQDRLNIFTGTDGRVSSMRCF
jgi:PBP1b-binding outer membrane lipoprotein LpoB